MVKLYVLSGDDIGRTYDLDGDSFVLGRGADADVTVRGASVSRKHARLERGDEGWRIVDLGSSNGMRVSGMKLAESDLADGETFHLGEIELRFREEVQAPAPVTAAEQQAETKFVPAPNLEPDPEPELEEEEDEDDGFDLEGDWDADASAAVEPVRSAKPSVTPAQPQAAPKKKPSEAQKRRAAAMGGAADSGGVRETAAGRKILQYNKIENRSGLFAADIGQQSGAVRLVMYAVVIALFAGLAYAAYTFTTASRDAAADVEATE